MDAKSTQLQAAVESMIDAHGMDVLLDALACVCHEKAEHVGASYGDAVQAAGWRSMGVKFTRLAVPASIDFGGSQTRRHEVAGHCAECGEEWPCTVDKSRASYRPEIAARHTFRSDLSRAQAQDGAS